jgi:crossover junction endonuclease EME1
MFLDRSFCMESGQIKSGTGPEDTFHKMLQHIFRVTPGVADAIISRYKCPSALIRGFQQGGPHVLEGLHVFL